MSSIDSASTDDHAYFQAIEGRFIQLRGAPLLLSPADWQLAKSWHEQGIPVDLVLETLDQVFAARRDRDAKGRVQGLRYCAPAVERAWEERRELLATGQRGVPPALDVEERLQALSERLADDGMVDNDLAKRVARLEGTAEEVEVQLTEIDRQMLDAVTRSLPEEDLAVIRQSVASSVSKIHSRLSAVEAAEIHSRLEREAIRRRFDLPVLSLFAGR